MHIIFSEYNDTSTNKLIDWFIYYNENFLRYNGYDKKNSYEQFSELNTSLVNGNLSFKYKYGKHIITSENISSIYYRRPNKGVYDFVTTIDQSDKFSSYIATKQRSIGRVLKKSFIHNIEKKCTNILGNYNKTELNKWEVLLIASSLDIMIPNTILTNSNNDVVDFFKNNNNSIICKSIEEVVFYHDDISDTFYSTLTILINTQHEIEQSHFSTSLFQENIIKDFEVRTFFLDGLFYSAAIFSQLNNKTKIDFRNYDDNKPHRIIPYKLPNKVEKKLTLLMQKLKLNIGSIDLIVRGSDHIFLEINPVGQYDFISFACNYNLDFHIANYLINEKEVQKI